MKKKLFPILCFFLVLCSMLPAAPASAATFNIDFETYSAAIELVNLDTDTIVYKKMPQPGGSLLLPPRS